jgi:hypothetical protein
MGKAAETGRKRGMAVEFIRLIRSMDHETLQSLIQHHAGEDLGRRTLPQSPLLH